MDKPERIGRGDGQRRQWRALTGQDVEHDVAADGAASDRLGTGGLDCIKPVAGHRAQDTDHLAIAIGMAAKAPPDPLERGGSGQSLNGAPLRNAPGFLASTGT